MHREVFRDGLLEHLYKSFACLNDKRNTWMEDKIREQTRIIRSALLYHVPPLNFERHSYEERTIARCARLMLNVARGSGSLQPYNRSRV